MQLTAQTHTHTQTHLINNEIILWPFFGGSSGTFWEPNSVEVYLTLELPISTGHVRANGNGKSQLKITKCKRLMLLILT